MRHKNYRGSNDHAGRTPDVGRLYAEHSARVYRWTLRFFSPDDTEEVVHEIFVKVLERIDNFRNDASPTTWLYRMTVNHCLNRLRDAHRRAEIWREQGRSSPWHAPAVEADQDTRTFLEQFWGQLDEELVTVAYHYFVDGMTHAEIARIHGCSPRTIGNRIDRLRALAHRAAGHDARETNA